MRGAPQHQKYLWDGLIAGFSTKSIGWLAERLTVKGIITGIVLTIVNSDPAMPLSAEQYPLGKLVALSDPSASAPN